MKSVRIAWWQFALLTAGVAGTATVTTQQVERSGEELAPRWALEIQAQVDSLDGALGELAVVVDGLAGQFPDDGPALEAVRAAVLALPQTIPPYPVPVDPVDYSAALQAQLVHLGQLAQQMRAMEWQLAQPDTLHLTVRREGDRFVLYSVGKSVTWTQKE